MTWFEENQLDDYLRIGLDNRQLAHLAGALFLGLFAVSALRRAKRSAGFGPAVWIAIAIALLGGTLIVAARGFPDEVPEFLKPWTNPERLTRVGAILALLAGSFVLLSAHWVRGEIGKVWYRVAGLALAGVAVWLSTGWFRDEVPEEARPWMADRVIVRAVIVLSLVCVSIAFWMRGNWSAPHVRWLNRSLSPIALAAALGFASIWFIAPAWPDYPKQQSEEAGAILTLIAAGTCLLIGAGAFLIRERPVEKPKQPTARKPALPETPPPARLPIAVMIDEKGQPILPGTGSGG